MRLSIVLKSVPVGKVVTYGQLADLCGMPNGARAIARALKGLPKDTQVAWHRVINSKGQISLPEPGYQEQKARLETEGIVFLNRSIDLTHYQWKP